MDCTHKTTRRRTPEDCNLNILYMSRDTATFLPRNASRWHVTHCDSIMLTAILPILPGGCSLTNQPTGVWMKATSTLDNAKRTTSFRDTRPWHWWRHNFPINRLQIFSHTLRSSRIKPANSWTSRICYAKCNNPCHAAVSTGEPRHGVMPQKTRTFLSIAVTTQNLA